MTPRLIAGAAATDITPTTSQFLFGYPHVERLSSGVHDPLLSSAMYINDGQREVLFIANDVIYVSKAVTRRVRERIGVECGIRPDGIMVTATHTHSGPVTVDCLFCQADPVVPKADPRYVQRMEDGMVRAAMLARQSARPAELGLAIADATGIGTNRRDAAGPSDPHVPVLLARDAADGRLIAAMLVCSMHPTVLHEDSTLVSGDFPGLARRHMQSQFLGDACVVLHHTGPAGNQSPRYVVRGQTFAEAQRLGQILGDAVRRSCADVTWRNDIRLGCLQRYLDLVPRPMPSVAQAHAALNQAAVRLAQLRSRGADRAMIRTAECDWFGAEETLTLAQAAQDGRLEQARQSCLPAEVQAIAVGPWAFVGWPGEIFVEHSLAVKARRPDAFVISLANGELQGYIATEAAQAEGGYEASNSLFAASNGEVLVDSTLAMLADIAREDLHS